MSINEVEKKQVEFDGVLGALSAYSSIKKEYPKAKSKLWNNAKNVNKGREKIIEGLKNGVFPLTYDVKKKNKLDTKKEKIISEMKIVLLILKSLRN